MIDVAGTEHAIQPLHAAQEALKPCTFEGNKDYTFFVCYDSNFTDVFQLSSVWTGIILIALPV